MAGKFALSFIMIVFKLRYNNFKEMRLWQLSTWCTVKHWRNPSWNHGRLRVHVLLRLLFSEILIIFLGEVSLSEAYNEVRWRPGQETNLPSQCSNLRSFGSKCIVGVHTFTIEKKICEVWHCWGFSDPPGDLAPEALCRLASPRYDPGPCGVLSNECSGFVSFFQRICVHNPTWNFTDYT